MLAKNPRPQYRSIIKKTAGVLFVIEAVSFAGSYFVWSRLNSSREFRHQCHINYPSILEGYYKIGEYLDTSNTAAITRQQDHMVWAAQAQKKE
ncbi:unnamed protein product [Diamesa serratosioi]